MRSDQAATLGSRSWNSLPKLSKGFAWLYGNLAGRRKAPGPARQSVNFHGPFDRRRTLALLPAVRYHVAVDSSYDGAAHLASFAPMDSSFGLRRPIHLHRRE